VDDLRPAFGRRIRALRLARHLSQEELAERANLHWTYISGIERGRRSPSLNSMGRLASALGVPLSSLVEELSKEPARPGKARRVRHDR
jgi:transcriptional regulator with XRE-family HTH domain